MIDQILRSLQEAAQGLGSAVGTNTKERTMQLIEDWLKIFPKLEIYGLRITSFGLSLALSPGLDVELVGNHDDWSRERIDKLLEENKRQAAMITVLTAIKTAYNLHRRIYATQYDPLIIKVRIRLSPEVKVVIGKPVLEN
ncbi:MAG: hypothetical protein WBA17_08290 [Saprospiraceae bacterium]